MHPDEFVARLVARTVGYMTTLAIEEMWITSEDYMFFVTEDLLVVEYDAYLPAFTEFYFEINASSDWAHAICVTSSVVVEKSEGVYERTGESPIEGVYQVRYPRKST